MASLQRKVGDKDYPRNHPPAEGRARSDTMSRPRSPYPRQCKSCYESKQADCSHCFKCGGPILHATVGRETAVGYPRGTGSSPPVKNTSLYCNCCQKEEGDVNFKRCSACKLVYYCSSGCQKRHWNDHQALCKVIQGLPQPRTQAQILILKIATLQCFYIDQWLR